jgi:hypothetical protein
VLASSVAGQVPLGIAVIAISLALAIVARRTRRTAPALLETPPGLQPAEDCVSRWVRLRNRLAAVFRCAGRGRSVCPALSKVAKVAK